jgi:hypothetical protein
MGRPFAPHTIAWDDQVAALVRDHASATPRSTTDLGALLGLDPQQQGTRLWPALNRLARAGVVRRSKHSRGPAFWQWDDERGTDGPTK